MLLFIISEVMVFGAFFTAYFFIRVAQGDPWPAPGTTLPVAVAAFNTAILVSSSFTMHWAQTSIKNGNRFGLQGRHPVDLPARLHVPVRADQRVRQHRLRAAGSRPGHDLLRPHRPARRARVHRPDPAVIVCVRSFRGHFSPEEHRGVEVPGIYWHFVDIMWIVVFTTVYVI